MIRPCKYENLAQFNQFKGSVRSCSPSWLFVIFLLAILLNSFTPQAIEYIEEDWDELEQYADWSCSYCGQSNDGQNDSCCACGRTR